MLRVLSLLAVILACGVGERRLLCSSEISEVWYTCDAGGFYYYSFIMEPCLQDQIRTFTLNYTIIMTVKLDHVRLEISVWHNNQKMLYMKKDLICMAQGDTKLCDIIKGESLSDSIFVKTTPYPLTKGSYYATLLFSDAADNEMLRCNVTATLK